MEQAREQPLSRYTPSPLTQGPYLVPQFNPVDARYYIRVIRRLASSSYLSQYRLVAYHCSHPRRLKATPHCSLGGVWRLRQHRRNVGAGEADLPPGKVLPRCLCRIDSKCVSRESVETEVIRRRTLMSGLSECSSIYIVGSPLGTCVERSC